METHEPKRPHPRLSQQQNSRLTHVWWTGPATGAETRGDPQSIRYAWYGLRSWQGISGPITESSQQLYRPHGLGQCLWRSVDEPDQGQPAYAGDDHLWWTPRMAAIARSRARKKKLVYFLFNPAGALSGVISANSQGF